MASIIKADTLQSTTANVFVLNSSGTEYARFDSSGNMGIGTNGSPSTQNGGVSLAVGLKGSQNLNLGFETNTLQNGGNLEFRRTGRTGSARYGQISGAEDNSGNGFLVFYASAVGADVTERVRINSFGIGLGVVPSSGTGIMFPATQSASSDPNTLDDYEEGTWSPVVTAESGSITTYAIDSANYTKTGNTVFVYVRFTVSNKGTGSNFVVSGLPFTSAAELLGNWAETNLLGLTGFMFTAGTGATSFTSRLASGWGGQCLANGSYTVQVTYRV